MLLSGATNDVVLDSFAGSGTTGQAVLELNSADGYVRNFILVQMAYETREQEDERSNICRTVTAERVRRVARGYKYSTPRRKKIEVEGLGGAFAYARLGAQLFNEYRDMGKNLPVYEELAKYIFYTET